MQTASCLTEGDESDQGSRESVGPIVRPTMSRGLNPRGPGDPADYGEGRERWTKIMERVECRKSLAKGKQTFIVVKRRGRRDARSGRLNRNTQRTGKTGGLTGSARSFCMKSPVAA
jgi:hypothetical protein